MKILAKPDGSGLLSLFYEHDWDAAEASLLRALALDARYPLAVGGLAQLLAALGRHNEAVFLMRQACDLDPFASYSAIMFGWALTMPAITKHRSRN